MFELTKDLLSSLKNAIIPERQLALLGPNFQYACPTCSGSCGGTCKGGCSRTSKSGR